MWSERQSIEIFHLVFLRSFGARVDKALFALKGGCNLRFYHRSVRYSEDMDLDIRTLAQGTLRSNVEAILEAPAFRQALRTHKIELGDFTSPKQTATTQRWKILLRTGDAGVEVPTKIEFSRRVLDDGTEVTPVEPELIRHYRLYPVIVQHYGAGSALLQKVAALALRTETQARDIFDLDLLRNVGVVPALNEAQRKWLPAAIENAMNIDFDDFRGQVVAYLEPEHQAGFSSRSDWEHLQDRVVAMLGALQT
jgi:hypothetical protein